MSRAMGWVAAFAGAATSDEAFPKRSHRPGDQRGAIPSMRRVD